MVSPEGTKAVDAAPVCRRRVPVRAHRLLRAECRARNQSCAACRSAPIAVNAITACWNSRPTIVASGRKMSGFDPLQTHQVEPQVRRPPGSPGGTPRPARLARMPLECRRPSRPRPATSQRGGHPRTNNEGNATTVRAWLRTRSHSGPAGVDGRFKRYRGAARSSDSSLLGPSTGPARPSVAGRLPEQPRVRGWWPAVQPANSSRCVRWAGATSDTAHQGRPCIRSEHESPHQR